MVAIKQLTTEEAIEFHDSDAWKELDFGQRARFQMSQKKLCMPFSVFHEAIEKTLGRPVFSHEFGMNYDGISDELFKGAAPPTIKEIMGMIPVDKRLILTFSGE